MKPPTPAQVKILSAALLPDPDYDKPKGRLNSYYISEPTQRILLERGWIRHDLETLDPAGRDALLTSAKRELELALNATGYSLNLAKRAAGRAYVALQGLLTMADWVTPAGEEAVLGAANKFSGDGAA